MLQSYQKTFIELAIEMKALQFGHFELKSGRTSPYFFNAGLFNTGQSLATLGQCFMEALKANHAQYDMLFGPAYKGISLGTATAIASNSPLPVAFNRKEAKTHGEKGCLMGAPLKGNVMIVDDVITQGCAKIEAIELIQSQGATVSGIIIALDRQEKGQGELSAKQEIEKAFNIPIYSIVTLNDITKYLETYPQYQSFLNPILSYRQQYGAATQNEPHL